MTARSPIAIEVLDGGLQASIQDAGRPGHESSGVGRGGAADRTALAVANLLAGNEPGAAVLEATLVPPALRAVRDVVLGVAGVDLGYVLEPGGRRVVPPCSVTLRAGDRLVPGGRGPDASGARAYLAPAGGIDVPVVLGSRATCLPAGFGGLEGRPLAAGDVIRIGPVAPVARRALVASELDLPADGGSIRVLPGPAAGGRPGRARFEAFVAASWSVSTDSDRRGLRLVGDRMATIGARPADRPSHGVVPGTIQLSPDGTPLVLMPDAGPTGGYPVIAVVIAADLDRLGQLRPGATVEFAAVDRRAAIAAEVDRRRWLARLEALATGAPAPVATLAPDPDPAADPAAAALERERERDAHGRWDEAWRSAGG